MDTDLVAYYKERAKEYEALYEKPERQEDLAKAATILKTIFAGKRVFEIGCGTGYWTQHLAEVAASVLATDINPEVLEIAGLKHYKKANVSFATADFNNYECPEKQDNLFAGFIWSHIELQQLDKFIRTMMGYTKPGARLVFMDNKYVPGSSLPVDTSDEYENTFQIRKVSSGNVYRVLKNFPDENFIRSKLAGYAEDIRFTNLKYYWLVRCVTRG